MHYGKQVILVLMVLCLSGLPLLAFEKTLSLSDREIVERLTRVEEKLNSIEQRFDERFDAMDKRFEAMDKRFENFENRMEQRFDQLINLMIGMMATFGGIVAATIGFAVWDRRTMIRPFETQVELIKTELKKQEAELSANSKKLHNLLDAFRSLAKTDIRVAEILKTFSLL